MGGKDGLVHVSEMKNERVEKPTDVVSEGQEVKVKVLEIDPRGKVRLSMRVVDQETGAELEDTRPPREPREGGVTAAAAATVAPAAAVARPWPGGGGGGGPRPRPAPRRRRRSRSRPAPRPRGPPAPAKKAAASSGPHAGVPQGRLRFSRERGNKKAVGSDPHGLFRSADHDARYHRPPRCRAW